MKRSIKHFPKQTQEELNYLLGLMRHYIKRGNMIILYGSYARRSYVLWDERVEFGIHTSYQSDYDILVVVSDLNNKLTEDILRDKVLGSYENYFSGRRHAIPRFIVENINALNANLERSQYFFTDVVKEGIMLYTDKKFALASPRKLNYREIKEVAEQEFRIYYPSAVSLLKAVKTYFLDNQDYLNAAFLLHQVAEKFYYSILLVCTNYRPKNHKLRELQSMVKSFSRDLSFVFPQDTEQARESYDLLCSAYIEARYNKHYEVGRDMIVYLASRLDFLREATHRLCMEKIAFYESMIAVDIRKIYPDPAEGESRAAED